MQRGARDVPPSRSWGCLRNGGTSAEGAPCPPICLHMSVVVEIPVIGAASPHWTGNPSVAFSSLTPSVRGPRRNWLAGRGGFETYPGWPADVYVFCHYPERDKVNANGLDVPAWDFYVTSAATLNQHFGEAKSLSLAAVRRAGIRCRLDGLKVAVDEQLPSILSRMRGSAEISGDIVSPVGEKWSVYG